jgi:lysophospholipase L1-like esterase
MKLTRSKKMRFFIAATPSIIALASTVFPLEYYLRSTASPQLRSMLDVASIMHWENGKGLVLKPGITQRVTLATEESTFTVTIDSTGYRTNDNSIQPDQQSTILMLGDSQTFGYGVNDRETFPSNLERELGVRVINSGFRSGSCTTAQCIYLRDFGLQHDPDLVVLNFYTGNDLEDTHYYNFNSRDNEGFPENLKVLGGWIPPYLKRTAIYQNFGLRVIPSLLKRDAQKKIDSARLQLKEIQKDQAAPDLALKVDFPLDLEWEVAEKDIIAMKHLCEKKDIPFVVILIPQEVPQPFIRRAISDKLIAFCEKEDIPVLDLEPLFLGDTHPDSYFFPIDGHLTAAGCASAAKHSRAFLAKMSNRKNAFVAQPKKIA